MTRPDKYILKGHKPVPTRSLMEWAEWFEKANRHVAKDVIQGIVVSTVFLGLDHQFGDDGPPLLFETMVFMGKSGEDEWIGRCSTWEEAEAMHAKAIKMVKEVAATAKGAVAKATTKGTNR